MKRLVMFSAALMLVALTAAASADEPVAQVGGAGKAALTDPDGNAFADNLFAITATLQGDGTADGRVTFLLGGAFSQLWGAVPGVDFIELRGEVAAVEVAADGTVILSGLLMEVDYSEGQGIVFVEENVPFEIAVSSDGTRFTLQWCLLPVFEGEVTEGRLHVN